MTGECSVTEHKETALNSGVNRDALPVLLNEMGDEVCFSSR
jgi:hypothetical protein